MITAPFAFLQGQAAPTPPAGWDPTLGGTVTPDYWWDLQNSAYMNLSGTQVNSVQNRGGQPGGEMTVTTYSGNVPHLQDDGSGRNEVYCSGNQRIGNLNTLIPHLVDCTVFVAARPVKPTLTQMVAFGHEGYTYSGNFAQVNRTTFSKTSANTQQYVIDGVVYGYGTSATFAPNSVQTQTRPRPESTTALWTIYGNGGIADVDIYGLPFVQISTREYTGVGNYVNVSSAFNSATMGIEVSTQFTPSTAPSQGTAIANQGRNAQLNPWKGGIYTVVVYLQKLSQAQITQLYNGWIADF